MKINSSILVSEPSPDYALLDSGDSEKLERFGSYTLARPDPQALWHKRLSASEWKKADGHFDRDTRISGHNEKVQSPDARDQERKGDWSLKKGMPEKWKISLGGLTFWIKPSSFKHTGIFPEQQSNWEWTEEKIKIEKSKLKNSDVEILNLFGYTGGATLAAAKAGAKVVHVDGSKVAISWARENAELSGLKDKPVRWILDDAHTFVKREVKRGRKYAGIIMDPPAFGHGPENELWKIEDHFLPLIDDCMKILSDQPLFFLVNGYSAGYSALAYENNLLPLKEKFGGTVEIGELTIREDAGGKQSKNEGRLLPAGIFARWSK